MSATGREVEVEVEVATDVGVESDGPQAAVEVEGPRSRRRVPIDPRIRDRRIAIRRDEGRRRLRFLAAAISVAAVAAGSVGVLHSPLLAVSSVAIEGNRQTARADLIRAAGLSHHPLMIDVDSATAAARIRELPWIATAHVGRRWPDGVHIRVTERAAIAVVAAASGGVDAVDVTGRILTQGPQTMPGLPLLTGVAPGGGPGGALDAPAAPALLRIAQSLGPELGSRVAQVSVGPDGTLGLHLAGGGAEVVLGSADLMADKLQALRTILSRVDLRGVTSIDVRVPQAPALTRR